MPARYFFNLTDGDAVIRDEEGVEVSDIQVAMIYAMEVVEELRAEDPANAETWSGWWLEIVDASGSTVQSISLNDPQLQ